jgi:hypothetical protein
MGIKLAAGIAVAIVAARRGWAWLLPCAVLLTIPTDFLGLHTLTILTAIPRASGDGGVRIFRSPSPS